MAHVSWKSKNHSRSNRTCYGWWFWCWKSFAIQIAKLYNCDVIATASPDKLDKCLELGADHAVDHRQDDWQ